MRTASFFWCVLSCALLTGCPWFQPPVVTIGAILPITGSAVEIGTQEKNAIELA
ncbi:MAG: hypothetical protein QG656_162, partial [Candidatus Hydrogenedentes bacterium]|nr:hypothetical protein [Candidatus Hydrogenedentota bacterium]